MRQWLTLCCAAAIFMGLVACNPENPKEETEIDHMDSTTVVIKNHTEKLEEQTEKVEASIEKVDDEFEEK